jgi:DMSO/TMAO reductase YedYZ molybdopterin-dependent catalytic subunit
MRKLFGMLILLAVIPTLAHKTSASPFGAQEAATILVVEGAVDHRLELTAADLAAMKRTDAALTEHDGTKKEYEGVPLTEVLQRAGVPLGAKLEGKALMLGAIVEATDGYKVSFTLAELDADYGNKIAVIADHVGGKPLTGNEAPLRLIVPGEKHPARSARMVKRIVVVLIGG